MSHQKANNSFKADAFGAALTPTLAGKGNPMLFRKKPKNPESVGFREASFWGASDRMICCSGIDGEGNEFNVSSHPKLNDGGYVATLEISCPESEQGIFIHAFYSGHWSFAVSPSNEESDELPQWEISRKWGSVNQHSETLTIRCPESAAVRVIDRIVAAC